MPSKLTWYPLCHECQNWIRRTEWGGSGGTAAWLRMSDPESGFEVWSGLSDNLTGMNTFLGIRVSCMISIFYGFELVAGPEKPLCGFQWVGF